MANKEAVARYEKTMESAKAFSFNNLKSFLRMMYPGPMERNPQHTKKGPGRKHKTGK